MRTRSQANRSPEESSTEGDETCPSDLVAAVREKTAAHQTPRAPEMRTTRQRQQSSRATEYRSHRPLRSPRGGSKCQRGLVDRAAPSTCRADLREQFRIMYRSHASIRQQSQRTGAVLGAAWAASLSAYRWESQRQFKLLPGADELWRPHEPQGKKYVISDRLTPYTDSIRHNTFTIRDGVRARRQHAQLPLIAVVVDDGRRCIRRHGSREADSDRLMVPIREPNPTYIVRRLTCDFPRVVGMKLEECCDLKSVDRWWLPAANAAPLTSGEHPIGAPPIIVPIAAVSPPDPQSHNATLPKPERTPCPHDSSRGCPRRSRVSAVPSHQS